MTDFTRIQYLIDQDIERKQVLHAKYERGEISKKDYIDSLPTTNQELIAHFNEVRESRKIDEKYFSKPTNPEDDMVVVNSNISGLVKAPKFGVKNKINLI